MASKFTKYECLGLTVDDYGQALVYRIKNLPELVQKEKGAAGEIAMALAPQTIANKVYQTAKDTLIASSKEKGVDADVQITSAPLVGPPPRGDLVAGIAIGVAGCGAGWLAWTRLLKPLFSR